MMALRGNFRDKGLGVEGQKSVLFHSHIFPKCRHRQGRGRLPHIGCEAFDRLLMYQGWVPKAAKA